MRPLLSCLLLVGLFGSPEQGSQSNTQGAASAEGQAAQIDKMLSEDPGFAKALSERLSNNPSFVGSLGAEVRKSWTQQQRGWTVAMSPNGSLVYEEIDPRSPWLPGGVKPIIVPCDSNDDLGDVIQQLAGKDLLASVLSYETSLKLDSKQIHQYRVQTISTLVSHLRARAEAAK
jgi:hypothetical protein